MVKVMQELFVDRHCAALAGTARELPFGDDTVIWTIDGRMFAAYIFGGEGLSLRLDDKPRRSHLVKERRAVSTPDLVGKGWMLLSWGTGLDELRQRINESYRLVRADGNAPVDA